MRRAIWHVGWARQLSTGFACRRLAQMPRNSMASSAEDRAGGEAGLPAELRRGKFLAVLRAQREDFDLPALHAHQQALLADVGDRADLALDLAEGTCEMLARLEHSQLLAVK